MPETDLGRGRRIVLVGLGLLFAGNGLWMLISPASWYAVTPGVEHTGPFNVHFIRDIGGIYLAMAAAQWLALRDWRSGRAALLVSLAWLTLHALVHAVEWLAHGHGDAAALATEALGVYAPPLILVLLLRGVAASRSGA